MTEKEDGIQTFISCDYYDECPLGACLLSLTPETQYRKFGLRQPLKVPNCMCKVNRDLKSCPKGFQ